MNVQLLHHMVLSSDAEQGFGMSIYMPVSQRTTTPLPPATKVGPTLPNIFCSTAQKRLSCPEPQAIQRQR